MQISYFYLIIDKKQNLVEDYLSFWFWIKPSNSLIIFLNRISNSFMATPSLSNSHNLFLKKNKFHFSESRDETWTHRQLGIPLADIHVGLYASNHPIHTIILDGDGYRSSGAHPLAPSAASAVILTFSVDHCNLVDDLHPTVYAYLET